MFECEVLAVEKAFEAAERFAKEQGQNGSFSRYITVFVDNLEAKVKMETAISEPLGSECLEALLVNNPRVRSMLHSIREKITRYESVELRWLRSHTGSKSACSRGNQEADRLAKEGLQKAFLLIEEPRDDLPEAGTNLARSSTLTNLLFRCIQRVIASLPPKEWLQLS